MLVSCQNFDNKKWPCLTIFSIILCSATKVSKENNLEKYLKLNSNTQTPEKAAKKSCA